MGALQVRNDSIAIALDARAHLALCSMIYVVHLVLCHTRKQTGKRSGTETPKTVYRRVTIPP